MIRMRIDPHVHFRDEEQSYRETISHGLSVAESQGVGLVFDMPNVARPVLTEDDVRRRLKLVPKEGKQRYRLYVGATSDPHQLAEAARLVSGYDEVIGIKMYAGKSVGDLAILSEEDQKKVYSVLAGEGYEGVIVVHCEKEKFTKDVFDPKEPVTHAMARPKIAEIESIKDQINFALEAGFKGNLHICHITTPEGVGLVDEARSKMRITCAATPHHLLWDESMLMGDHGLLYKMNPPLRKKEDVMELRRCLSSGKIDWIETDHAPHAIGEKLNPPYMSGYPTLYIYRDFVENFLPSQGLTAQQINDLTCNNIMKAFGIDI
jgi:dihydroorotase